MKIESVTLRRIIAIFPMWIFDTGLPAVLHIFFRVFYFSHGKIEFLADSIFFGSVFRRSLLLDDNKEIDGVGLID